MRFRGMIFAMRCRAFLLVTMGLTAGLACTAKLRVVLPNLSAAPSVISVQAAVGSAKVTFAPVAGAVHVLYGARAPGVQPSDAEISVVASGPLVIASGLDPTVTWHFAVGATEEDKVETLSAEVSLRVLGTAWSSASIARVPVWARVGGDFGGRFGFAVQPGDFTGDGVTDVVASAYLGEQSFDEDVDEGVALLFKGVSPEEGYFEGTPVEELSGSDARTNSQLGFSLCAGNMNSTTGLDLVVGAPNDAGVGVAYEYYGGVPLTGGVEAAGGHPKFFLEAGLGTGLRVACGNSDSDAYADVAIGLPGPSTSVPSGRVWIIKGRATGWPVGSATVDQNVFATSTTVGARFGYALAYADTNCDGRDDLLVGSPGAGGSNRGRADLFLGLATGLVEAAPSWSFLGSSALQARLGSWVANAGDVNGDGCEDILVASIAAIGATSVEADRLHLFLGTTGGIAAVPSRTIASVDVSLSEWGYASGDFDLNGDGYDDVAIGCFRCDDDENLFPEAGRVEIYAGGPQGLSSSAIAVMSGDRAAANFGHGLSAADVDGDGSDDLFVGSSGWTGLGDSPNEGRLELFLGPPKAGPLVNAGAPRSAPADTSVSFLASFSDIARTASHRCTWEFGDGSLPVVIESCNSANVSVTHPVGSPGTYAARLTVENAHGITGQSSTTVTVTSAIDQEL